MPIIWAVVGSDSFQLQTAIPAEPPPSEAAPSPKPPRYELKFAPADTELELVDGMFEVRRHEDSSTTIRTISLSSIRAEKTRRSRTSLADELETKVASCLTSVLARDATNYLLLSGKSKSEDVTLFRTLAW